MELVFPFADGVETRHKYADFATMLLHILWHIAAETSVGSFLRKRCYFLIHKQNTSLCHNFWIKLKDMQNYEKKVDCELLVTGYLHQWFVGW